MISFAVGAVGLLARRGCSSTARRSAAPATRRGGRGSAACSARSTSRLDGRRPGAHRRGGVLRDPRRGAARDERARRPVRLARLPATRRHAVRRGGSRARALLVRRRADVRRPGYDCPFCRLPASASRREHNRLATSCWRDESTTAFISPRWWPDNHGHVLVIPNEHVETSTRSTTSCSAPLFDRQADRDRAEDGVRLRGHLDAPAQRARGRPGRLAPPRPRLPALPRRPALRAPRGERWASPDERAPYARSCARSSNVSDTAARYDLRAPYERVSAQ